MSQTHEKTLKLAQLAMLIAIEAIMTFLPIGFIMVPPVSITLLHIPVIIGAILMGPLYGGILGGSFVEEESSGVLQRLIEGNDLTLYGLSNAVTRHSQDVEDYDRATALEGIGYNILSMPARQWSRINQMAA